MSIVEVKETVDVPRSALFEVLTDHAHYDRFPGISGSELIQTGRDDKNGTGAVRRIRLGPTVLDEEIIAFEAPHTFSYRIVRIRPVPVVNHKIGSLTFTEVTPERTEVLWTSEFEVGVPVLGKVIGKQLVQKFTRGFRAAILAAAKLAAKSPVEA